MTYKGRIYAAGIALLILGIGSHSQATKSAKISFASMHVRMAPPAGWDLNETFVEKGWISLYWKKVKDPSEASIDVIFYPNGTSKSTRADYMKDLEASTKMDPTFDYTPRKKTSAMRTGEINGLKTSEVTYDYIFTLHTHTMKAKRAPCRETYVLIELPQGLIAARLQSRRDNHAALKKYFRLFASSIEPI